MRTPAAWLWLVLTPSLLTAAGQVPDVDKLPPPTEAPLPRAMPSQVPVPPEVPTPQVQILQVPVPQMQLPNPNGSCLTKDLTLPTCSLAESKENFRKLKTERETLQAERLTYVHASISDASFAEENAKLRLRLGEVLTRLGSKMNPPRVSAPPPASETPAKPPDPTTEKSSPQKQPPAPAEGGGTLPLENARPLDPMALAQVLFKAGNYGPALQTFRLIDQRGMKADERLPIQYLIASCLKRLGKTEEAAGVFREIANSRGDENLAVCAQWQLSALRWQQDMRTQLDTIRQRRKALEKTP
jgi:hypothetical protein